MAEFLFYPYLATTTGYEEQSLLDLFTNNKLVYEKIFFPLRIQKNKSVPKGMY